MIGPIRLRRHTDGHVATRFQEDGYYRWGCWWVGLDGCMEHRLFTDAEVSGDGWSELFVAELPEPDGHIIGDHWALSTISCYVSTDGHTVDIDGIPFSLDQLRSDALKMLAAVAACERFRAEREATS